MALLVLAGCWSLWPMCVYAAGAPNILVLMTDDQDARSVQTAMTQPGGVARLKAEGTTFTRYFASYALCCPSRATFLTGQYAHNHKVMDNRRPLGGYRKLDYRNTLPVWLQQAGYYTAHIGKFLNGYGQSDHPLVPGAPPYEIPQGWHEWYGSIDPYTYRYFRFRLNENGTVVSYSTATAHYQTDVYVAKARAFLEQRAQARDGKPFFLSVAFLAPHTNDQSPYAATPAPRHRGRFATLPLPRPPSFNEADVADKPSFIRALPRLTSLNVNDITSLYRSRLESLLTVDEGIATLLEVLHDTGQLEDTVVIFLSDNGFFHGEHRIKTGKYHLYEESIRIPLVMRGPGIPAGQTIARLAVNVDLAATILDLADASPGRVQDGRSLVPLLQNPGMSWRTSFLVEGGPVEANGWQAAFVAVRSQRYLYSEHNTDAATPEPEETQFYDLSADPYQLRSQHNSTSPTHVEERNKLKNRLSKLKTCAGASCW
jgi:arylsulfatase A-like enzyme